MLATPALAQANWPDRPIRWIINFPPGGAADILSRILAEHFGARFGQPIVVENRPGAGGMVGADIVAKARGDAHTVMISSASSHGIGPVLYRSVPYDPLADFTHVHLVGSFPSVLAVNGSSPIQDFAGFMAAARPGGMTYATGGNGTMNHLVGQLLKQEGRVELTHVPYRGSAAAMTDVMAGQVPAVMESLPTAMGHFRGGRLKPIAQSEEARDSTLPEVPTFRELGLPGVTSSNWFGFSIASGVPAAVVERWEGAMKEALAAPMVQQRFAAIGVRPGTLGPAAYTALITSELDRWRQVIRANNIQAD
ncbi:tripartite tricarboxylate transporter substrate binding protein [Rhodovarius crocodyli]|uniref:Tripartite tricarboxylate transporter substrate binding protein n=2 Tax=Rhodovarius crocodyli TaxID=1979269 RepID=A0A437MFL1_9PROT|nr:tripartite tricarboxylate transporter substrate binding protein [Rhodovarius crocodyli]